MGPSFYIYKNIEGFQHKTSSFPYIDHCPVQDERYSYRQLSIHVDLGGTIFQNARKCLNHTKKKKSNTGKKQQNIFSQNTGVIFFNSEERKVGPTFNI